MNNETKNYEQGFQEGYEQGYKDCHTENEPARKGAYNAGYSMGYAEGVEDESARRTSLTDKCEELHDRLIEKNVLSPFWIGLATFLFGGILGYLFGIVG